MSISWPFIIIICYLQNNEWIIRGDKTTFVQNKKLPLSNNGEKIPSWNNWAWLLVAIIILVSCLLLNTDSPELSFRSSTPTI